MLLSSGISFKQSFNFRLNINMRNFSKEEENILNQLISSNTLKLEGMILFDVFLEDYFFGDEHNSNIYVDSGTQEVFLSIRSDDIVERREETVRVIVMVNLLMNLMDLGIISFIGMQNEIKKCSGQQYNNTLVKIDQPISSFLLEKLGNFILPSEELKELVNNNFKNLEAIRHRQTMILAIVAIAVSLLIGLLGIFV